MPWELPEGFPSAHWTSEIVSLQCLAQGTADEFQQRLAWKFIVEVLCRTDEQTFFPEGQGGDRVSAFAEGLRWVGRMMRMVSRLRPSGPVNLRDEPPPMPAAQRSKGE